MNGDIVNKPVVILLCEDVVNAFFTRGTTPNTTEGTRRASLEGGNERVCRASPLSPANRSKEVPLLSLD